MEDEIWWEVYFFSKSAETWIHHIDYKQSFNSKDIDIGYVCAKESADRLSRRGYPVKIIERTVHRRVAYEDLKGVVNDE